MSTSIRSLKVSTYRVPTLEPEADGTASWSATELVVVQPVAADQTGLGWSYCTAPAAAQVTNELLAPVVLGGDALDVPLLWQRMIDTVRNAGRPGLLLPGDPENDLPRRSVLDRVGDPSQAMKYAAASICLLNGPGVP